MRFGDVAMGSKGSKAERDYQGIKCLSKRFRRNTLNIVANRFFEYPSGHMNLEKQLEETCDSLVNSIFENARKNNGLVIVDIELGRKHKAIMNVATFCIRSEDQARVAALQMMILHAIFVENDGFAKFSFKMDPYERDGNDIVWLKPRITGSFGSLVEKWFNETTDRGIIDTQSIQSIDDKPVFHPKINYPNDDVVIMLESPGIMLHAIRLINPDVFWRHDKFN